MMMTFPFRSHLTCCPSSCDERSILSQWTEDISTSDIYPPRFLKRGLKWSFPWWLFHPTTRSRIRINLPKVGGPTLKTCFSDLISPPIKVEQVQVRKPVGILMACQASELSGPLRAPMLWRDPSGVFFTPADVSSKQDFRVLLEGFQITNGIALYSLSTG